MRYSLIMFDMDGTLIDSRRFHEEALYRFFKKYWKHVPYEAVADGIGATVKSLFNAVGVPESRHEELYTALDLFYKMEAGELIARIQPCDGAQELLRELRNRGVKLALVTNSLQSVVDGALENCGLQSSFDWILGADRHSKDKIERCRQVQLSARAEDEEVLYVGDTEGDMMLANQLGYDACFCMTDIGWYLDEDEIISALQPRFVVKELLDLLSQLDGDIA